MAFVAFMVTEDDSGNNTVKTFRPDTDGQETVTLTVTKEEARKIERALKARSCHWLSPENIKKERAFKIAQTYMKLAGKIKQQIDPTR